MEIFFVILILFSALVGIIFNLIPFIIFIFITPLLIFQINKIRKLMSKYPKIYNGSKLFNCNNNLLSYMSFTFFSWGKILSLNAFSKENHQKYFSELYNFNEVKKSKNKNLISILEKHRVIHRTWILMQNLFVSGLIILSIVLLITFAVAFIYLKILK